MSANPLFTLLNGADQPDADRHILQAALDQFALTGVRRTSTDDIARRAGVNRATLYRRLGAKNDIVAAAFRYEAGRVLAQIDAGIGVLDTQPTPADVDDYIVRFFTTTLTTLRGNRLLHQLLAVDRDETLRALTIGAADVVELSSAFLAERIRAIRERSGGSTEPAQISALAAVLARLTQSLLLTPDAPPPVQTPDQMRRFAETLLIPMIRGAAGS